MNLKSRIGGAIAARLPLWVSAIVAAIAAGLGVLSGGAAKPVVPLGEPTTIPVTDNVQPIEYEGLPYEPECLSVAHADGRAIPTKRITYWIDPTGLASIRPATTPAAVRAAFVEAWASWSVGLDIEPIEVGDQAGAIVRHHFASIDGAGRTLAWSMLSDGSGKTLVQRYDVQEAWTMGGPAPNLISLPAVAAHEIGHALGLDHDNATANSILRPYYNAEVTRPTERDFARAVTIGYKRRVAAPPDVPSDNPLSLNVWVKGVDLADVLRKAGWQVIPPAK